MKRSDLETMFKRSFLLMMKNRFTNEHLFWKYNTIGLRILKAIERL
jgi:hypothetical protein